MGLFRWGGSIMAIAAALGGYSQLRYETFTPCGAAEVAVRSEMPKALDELAESDMRFRALKVGGALLGGGVEAAVEGAAAEIAADDVRDKGVIECVVMVAQREFDPKGFREDLGKRFGDRMARSLGF